jgi:hypothetical protein
LVLQLTMGISRLLKSFLLLASVAAVSGYGGPVYKMTDSVTGWDFYDFFDWEAIDDPTHGRV